MLGQQPAEGQKHECKGQEVRQLVAMTHSSVECHLVQKVANSQANVSRQYSIALPLPPVIFTLQPLALRPDGG